MASSITTESQKHAANIKLDGIRNKFQCKDIEWVHWAFSTKTDLVKFTCQHPGCNEISQFKKECLRGKSELKCKYHTKNAKRPIEFEDFMKYITILYPLYLQTLEFKETDFYNDLEEWNKLKINYNGPLKSEKDINNWWRPKRKVTAWCKKHGNRINIVWGLFFKDILPQCKSCSKHGVSQQQIYIMNFVSEILNLNIRHQYNHVDGEYYDDKVEWRGRVDGFCNKDKIKIINSIKANNQLLNLKIQLNPENTSYKGFIFEYNPSNYHHNKIHLDEEKCKLYLQAGYCIVILTDIHWRMYKKSIEWKQLITHLNNLWITYKIRPTSLKKRILEHHKNTRKNIETDMYINKTTDCSGKKRCGYYITIRPEGCDIDKWSTQYQLSLQSTSYFTMEELHVYALRVQKIILDYVNDCCKNMEHRLISFEEKENRVEKIRAEYNDEKRKRIMNDKISMLKSGYYTDKFNEGKLRKRYPNDCLGIHIKLKEGRDGGSNYQLSSLTYSNHINSHVSNYFENLDDMIMIGELYIKKVYFPNKVNIKEFQDKKEYFIIKAIVKKYTKDILNSNNEFIGIKCKYMKLTKNKISKEVCNGKSGNEFYLRHTKPYGRQNINSLSNDEISCRKIVHLYLCGQYFLFHNNDNRYNILYQEELQRQKELSKICYRCGRYVKGRMDKHMKRKYCIPCVLK
tara:strand:+ start:68 stop:2119 length:2052 start_codon:yes stop_codon:yes gene_type:complete